MKPFGLGHHQNDVVRNSRNNALDVGHYTWFLQYSSSHGMNSGGGMDKATQTNTLMTERIELACRLA